MQKTFLLSNYLKELKILGRALPNSPNVKALLKSAYIYTQDPEFYSITLKNTQITASLEPWSQVQFQSLYIKDGSPEDRLVLQQPSFSEETICVTVLKAARLSGMSGMVYCGTEGQLNQFNSRLAEYEKLAEELSEEEFLQCLSEVAEKEFGLKIVYMQLSPDHGGEDDEDED